MSESIHFSEVSDLYDFYVKVDFDIPFFLNETKLFRNEILELMCGTGRVSIPLPLPFYNQKSVPFYKYCKSGMITPDKVFVLKYYGCRRHPFRINNF